MDAPPDSQATQQATQNVLDPRRIGQQNSGFSDQDISDIICLLYPLSEPASREVQRIASSPVYAHHTVGRYSADAIKSDLSHEDDPREFGRSHGIGDHALVLRLSSTLKDPSLGFTFGRNGDRCDICFAFDPGRRLSNIHFRIYVNSYGSVLLEDQSTNGTVVDNLLLRRRPDPNITESHSTRRTLESGSTIKIVMHETKCDLLFLVRIPLREGAFEEAFLENLESYLQRLNGIDDLNKTIGPGPSGHVQLFTPARAIGLNNQVKKIQSLQKPSNRLPREWRGGEKYARVGVIGKGAFATVHKVTAKYDGAPYAAKELDKRKFMKNGILDQKVENEMKIMQKVHHANIVQYIEHFDWDVHQFIIIMEYVPGGDLGKFIHEHGTIVEPYVKIIAAQLVDALGYLHANHITHRDVKPDNILIQSTDPLVVKLTDFGLSKMIDTEQTFLKTFCGTLLYCAPEVYTEYSSYDNYGRRTNRKGHRSVDRERYGHAVDIWSLGGVLFYTLTGNPPYPVQSGTTYTQLLDHIMKTSLDTSHLVSADVSKTGIHFLSRMIHVRPETRATIAELESHAWLHHAHSLADQVSDDALDQSASQLSLDDRQLSQSTEIDQSSISDPESDNSMDFETDGANLTIRPTNVAKLFGEVSVIGSSGVIPEERLNLPVSDMSLGDTDAIGSEVRDTFEESDDFSTPRDNLRRNNVSFKREYSPPDNSRSVVLGIGSQSLGGASSILKNLNMKSTANATFGLASSRASDLATSKRKPDDSPSEGHDMSNSNATPALKRLKSEGDVDILEDEDHLLANVPKISNSSHQIDYPVPKRMYWDGEDDTTWHLNYPEMTLIQHTAFKEAAKKRHEEFKPGTALWKLAMKHFPPSHRKSSVDPTHKNSPADTLAFRPKESNNDQRPVKKHSGQNSHQDLPATDLGLDISTFRKPLSSAVPGALVTNSHPRTEIGVFRSMSGSPVSLEPIHLRDSVLSWGRNMSNTAVYKVGQEARVPKNAFRVLLWTEGHTASELRPWEPTRSGTSHTTRASPEPDSYAFYIATKATNGIHINTHKLYSHEPTEATVACKNWMKLYHGDQIVFWTGGSPPSQVGLVFECFWGGSSKTRPADERPTCVPSHLAKKLDRLWPRAIRSLGHARINEEAQADTDRRMQDKGREDERSRVFEQKRLNAIRRIAQQESRGPSPLSN
ncbi:Pkinase-domain-containing protein [Nemania sp. NC0429]|nr:Pkinase-domain-containing protein [Nemania sp. NC0429]